MTIDQIPTEDPGQTTSGGTVLLRRACIVSPAPSYIEQGECTDLLLQWGSRIPGRYKHLGQVVGHTLPRTATRTTEHLNVTGDENLGSFINPRGKPLEKGNDHRSSNV